ncbi:carbohydrate ABC transporter permease [Kaistia adipata]|uniref:carbohydrate ABC transporter permease n=1 Tax=Kaistia adipata TaxID=166954 RepID=UPI000410FB9F|nr:carbohydrate ABC transporter permease [Kaistia adipata]
MLRTLAGRLGTFAGAMLILLFTGGPVLMSLTGSLVPDRVLFDENKGLLDEGIRFDNYRYIFTGELPDSYQQAGANRAMISQTARQVPFALVNSVQISFSAALLALLLATPAAYMYARVAFRGKKLTFMFLILSPLVPTVALVTPIYMTIEAMGLLGSKLGIIFVHAVKAIPFVVLIISVFFRKLPVELFEAAQLDGCTRMQTFLRIALPVALPSVAATGLFAFMLSYAEFMFSMVLSGDSGSRPISVVMAALARNTDVSWGLLNASIFIAIVPTLILVAMVWRFVVEGMLRGAIKG